MPNSSEEPVSFWQQERPWWHTEHVYQVRNRVVGLPVPELRGLAEEMKGAIATLQQQMETAGPEIAPVRELSRQLGPVKPDVLAAALGKKYDISVEEGRELVDAFDWWKSVRGALGFIRQKHSLVVAEITRRRSEDAEQAVFDIKGKIEKACMLMDRDEGDDIEDAYKLLLQIRERLSAVGP
jgi:hypothetical protein